MWAASANVQPKDQMKEELQSPYCRQESLGRATETAPQTIPLHDASVIVQHAYLKRIEGDGHLDDIVVFGEGVLQSGVNV